MKRATIFSIFAATIFLAGIIAPKAHAGVFGISPGTAQAIIEQGQDATVTFYVSQQGAEGDKAIYIRTGGEAFDVEMEEDFIIPSGSNIEPFEVLCKTADLEPGTYTVPITITEERPDAEVPAGSIPIALGITANIEVTVVDAISEEERQELVEVSDVRFDIPDDPRRPVEVSVSAENTGPFMENNNIITVQLMDKSGQVVDEFETGMFALAPYQTSEQSGYFFNIEPGKYTVSAKVQFREYESAPMEKKLVVSFGGTGDDTTWFWWVLGGLVMIGGVVVIFRNKKQSNKK